MALMAMQLSLPLHSRQFHISSFCHPQMQVPRHCRGSSRRSPLAFSAMASSSSEGRNEAQTPPKKKPHRFFEYRIHRPVKSPNYLLWAGLVFAFLMRGTIVEEVTRWPGFALKLWELLKVARDRITEYLLLNAKEPFLFTLELLAWLNALMVNAYAYVVDSTPVWALTRTMVLSSTVASIGETVRRDAADQPWILGFAGLAGLGGAADILNDIEVVALLLVATIASYVKRRDVVVALLPAAAVMVAVGLPKVQVITFVTYVLLAVYRNWVAPEDRGNVVTIGKNATGPPLILVVFALMVGTNLTVNWLHARNIVWLAST